MGGGGEGGREEERVGRGWEGEREGWRRRGWGGWIERRKEEEGERATEGEKETEEEKKGIGRERECLCLVSAEPTIVWCSRCS